MDTDRFMHSALYSLTADRQTDRQVSCNRFAYIIYISYLLSLPLPCKDMVPLLSTLTL